MNDKIIDTMTEFVSKLDASNFDDINMNDVNQMSDGMCWALCMLDDIDVEETIANDYYFDIWTTLLRNRYNAVTQ